MPASDKAEGTVGKALEVLELIAETGKPVRFSELLKRSAFPKATLYRLLQTLTNQEMLSYEPERQTYSLGIRLVRLAHAAWAQSSLARVAGTHLDALSRAVDATVHLAQLDGGQVLYVDKRNSTRPLDMFSEAGKIGPAYCTGVGKAMLAHLPEDELEAALARQSYHRFTPKTLTSASALRKELERIRRRGHAVDDEEHEPGIICIAVPILSPSGRVLGGLSVTGSTARTDLARMEQHAPLLQAAATDIARNAENWRFPDGKKTIARVET